MGTVESPKRSNFSPLLKLIVQTIAFLRFYDFSFTAFCASKCVYVLVSKISRRGSITQKLSRSQGCDPQPVIYDCSHGLHMDLQVILFLYCVRRRSLKKRLNV